MSINTHVCSCRCLRVCSKADKHRRQAQQLFATVMQVLQEEDSEARGALVRDESRWRGLVSRYASDPSKPRTLFFWELTSALFSLGDMGRLTQDVAFAQFLVFAHQVGAAAVPGNAAPGTCDGRGRSATLLRVLRADDTVWLPVVTPLRPPLSSDRPEFEGM